MPINAEYICIRSFVAIRWAGALSSGWYICLIFVPVLYRLPESEGWWLAGGRAAAFGIQFTAVP